jgi:hypothetical protein
MVVMESYAQLPGAASSDSRLSGRMNFIEAILGPVIERILAHLGLEQPPPPKTTARETRRTRPRLPRRWPTPSPSG